MRVVLDTDVVVAAMRSPQGASAWMVRQARFRRIGLMLTVPLAVEYEAVCLRREHHEAGGLSAADARVFVDTLIAVAERVKTHFLWRPQLDDASDEMVLEAAINGKADGLVTFNLRHFEAASRRFGIRAMAPRDAVLALRKERTDR